MGAVHGKKALVVISNGKSTRANGYLDRLENELKQSKAEYIIFDKVGSNPTKPRGGRRRTFCKRKWLRLHCGVSDLKMSDYGITSEEFPKMAQNARETLGINFENDMYKLSDADCVAIYQEFYK